MSRDTHQMEKLLFIDAVEGLTLAGQSTGFDAYIEAVDRRTPDGIRPFCPVEEGLSAEDLEYFREMGAFVELALQLSNGERA